MMALANEIGDDYRLSHWLRRWSRLLNLVSCGGCAAGVGADADADADAGYGYGCGADAGPPARRLSRAGGPHGARARRTGCVARISAAGSLSWSDGRGASVGSMRVAAWPTQWTTPTMIAVGSRRFDSLGPRHRTSSARSVPSGRVTRCWCRLTTHHRCCIGNQPCDA
jgi:hypothetical protein